MSLELRFHFGERDRGRDRHGDRSLEVAVMDACARAGVQAAALLRGVEGFGGSAIERTDRLLSLSEDAPLVAVALGEGRTIEALAEEVRGVAGGGLLTLEEVDVVGDGAAALAPTGTATTSAAEVGVPVGGSPGDRGRDVVRATVWGPRSGSGSPHLAAVDAFHRHGADSATVLLGVDGVIDGERRRARFVAANRGVPAITVAIGERGAITAALAELGAVANLVTIETVETSSRIAGVTLHGDEGVERKWRIEPPTLHGDGGEERNRPHATERLHGEPGVEDRSRIARGMLHRGGPSAAAAEGTRVTLVTSEIARGGEHPLYLELIHELRRAGAPGATALRGVWGFRGGVAPHGDRVLALRRDVPMVVETVDSAGRVGEWLEVAEALAGASDVSYSQLGLRIFTLD